VNAAQAWEEIAALSRPLQPYATDRRAVLERILRVTEEASDVHASSAEMREVAQIAVTALSSSEMKVLTTALARIYTTALIEAVRARPID
jgi:acetolactate synthase regulatory subunit